MSYVAVVVVNKDNSIHVHVDSSVAESFKTMELVVENRKIKNVFRKVVDESLFTAYSNGSELIANIIYDWAGIPAIYVSVKSRDYYDFFIREELRSFGLTEDGEDYTGYTLFVCAEHESGARFAHYKRFNTVGPDFENVYGKSYSRAELLLKMIIYHTSDGTPLAKDCWEEIDPRYGSEKYISMDDLGIFKDREKKENASNV